MKSQFHAQGDMNELKPPAETLSELPKTLPLRAVALKRSFGMGIDAASIGLIAMTPCLYRLLTLNPLPIKPIIAILSDNATFLCFCLAFSPLPLIYLRLVFRKLLHTSTPGEMFAGVTTITLIPGFTGIVQEIVYASIQYIAMAFGAILGLVTLTVLGIFGLWGDDFNWFVITAFFAAPLLSLIFMSTIYLPHSESDYAAAIDNLCGLEVKRLR